MLDLAVKCARQRVGRCTAARGLAYEDTKVGGGHAVCRLPFSAMPLGGMRGMVSPIPLPLGPWPMHNPYGAVRSKVCICACSPLQALGLCPPTVITFGEHLCDLCGGSNTNACLCAAAVPPRHLTRLSDPPALRTHVVPHASVQCRRGCSRVTVASVHPEGISIQSLSCTHGFTAAGGGTCIIPLSQACS